MNLFLRPTSFNFVSTIADRISCLCASVLWHSQQWHLSSHRKPAAKHRQYCFMHFDLLQLQASSLFAGLTFNKVSSTYLVISVRISMVLLPAPLCVILCTVRQYFFLPFLAGVGFCLISDSASKSFKISCSRASSLLIF